MLALVVSVEDDLHSAQSYKKLFDIVDYYPWISQQNRTSLPWTGKASDNAADYIEEEGVNQILARMISHGSVQKAEDADRPEEPKNKE